MPPARTRRTRAGSRAPRAGAQRVHPQREDHLVPEGRGRVDATGGLPGGAKSEYPLRPTYLLGQATVANLGEAPQALDDVERVLAARPGPRPGAIDGALRHECHAASLARTACRCQ